MVPIEKPTRAALQRMVKSRADLQQVKGSAVLPKTGEKKGKSLECNSESEWQSHGY